MKTTPSLRVSLREISALAVALVLSVGAVSTRADSTELSQGWAFRSQTGLADTGATISQPGYNVSSWYPISLPSTVMAGLVTNNVYTNVFFGNNLQSVPDLTPQNWWYRGEFIAPINPAGGQFWLRFKGIAYRGKIYLNGTAVDTNAVGTMVNHEYNVTGLVHAGSSNALAVLVTPPLSSGNNLSYWYVDWNPKPPDMNAGICNKVLFDNTGPVVLRDPYVKTVLPLPATNSADLTVYVDAVNGSASSVTGSLSGIITKPGYPSITFTQNVTLNPSERREISFTPNTNAQLHVTNPALWWPVPLGNPELYNLQLTFSVGGQASDTKSVDFGIRQMTDYITPTIYGSTYRGYKVNGQNVVIRGADYVWDMFMRWNSKINQAHVDYVRDMGLNLIRFEGILGNDELYDFADRAGVMLMPGFVCCTHWSDWSAWSTEDHTVGNASLESQMRLMRAHPSALVWNYGSDELPTAAILSAYKGITTNLHWQNPTLDNVASYNNASGSVPKMNGPYVWEPPIYWYADTANGGAFGFCAEQGGESVPPEESLRKFIAPTNLWPIGTVYGYHAGASPFDNLDFYTPGVTNRYGNTTNVTQYADRAQLLNYESERAQFEAFGANAYTLAQGTVYWMLNNGWPSVHWNLYDYFFKPGGSYFGSKKALEPVHILYDYNTTNVDVFNSTLTNANNFVASVKVYNIPDLTLKYTNQVTTNFPANSSKRAFSIPTIAGLTTTYFVRLQLKDAGGKLASDNLYWYSITADKLGSKSTWYNTSIGTYANLTGLNSLPANTNVLATASRTSIGGQETVTITLTNRSTTNIAFFVRAEVTAGSNGLEVLPIIYNDNYITLWPGEATTLIGHYATSDLGGQTAYVRVRGYNVPEFSVLGTDSIIPPVQLTIQLADTNGMQVCWNSANGHSYQPEYSSIVATNNWAPLGGQVSGNGSTMCVFDPPPLSSNRFYRVRQLP